MDMVTFATGNKDLMKAKAEALGISLSEAYRQCEALWLNLPLPEAEPAKEPEVGTVISGAEADKVLYEADRQKGQKSIVYKGLTWVLSFSSNGYRKSLEAVATVAEEAARQVDKALEALADTQRLYREAWVALKTSRRFQAVLAYVRSLEVRKAVLIVETILMDLSLGNRTEDESIDYQLNSFRIKPEAVFGNL